MLSRTAPFRLVPLQTSASYKGRSVAFWGTSIFFIALTVRLVVAVPRDQWRIADLEPVNIATSLATTGNYADAFGPGTGPTAHSSPIQPLLLTVLFRIFGTGPRGAIAVGVLGCIEASLAFALLPWLGAASELGLRSGALAGICGALLPVNYWSQTNGSFEGPLSAAMLILLCVLLCGVWETRTFTPIQGTKFGIVAGMGCLITPVIIPVLLSWAIISSVRYRHDVRRVLAFCAFAVISGVIVLSPWAIRNYRTLGKFIWTRSNLGLELQVSNNDFMTASLERNVDMREYGLFHPHRGAAERQKIKAMGEVEYQHAKMQQALTWIRFHKRRFSVLTAERFWLFWLPGMQQPWQTAVESVLTILGLTGLVLLFWQGWDVAWIMGGVFASYPLIYYFVQASPRYRLPLEYLLFVLAVHAIAFIVERASASEQGGLITLAAVETTVGRNRANSRALRRD